jgi:hypothetical protein
VTGRLAPEGWTGDVDPLFRTRPTVTGRGPGDQEGIVVMVNGHDLFGLFPDEDDQGVHSGWTLGHWDPETDEWIEDAELTDEVAAFLAKGQGTDG